MVYIPQGKGHGGVIRILITFNAQIEKVGKITLKNMFAIMLQFKFRMGLDVCLVGVFPNQFEKSITHLLQITQAELS